VALGQPLISGGVRAAFGVPGSGPTYDLVCDLEDQGVPFYGARHEAAAAIMAGAFGRLSRTLACSISIRGAGVANMLPGIASNHFERWPALSVSDGTRAGVAHKRLDHQALLAPVVKAYACAGDCSGVPGMLQYASAEVPGPAHLDLLPGAATLAPHGRMPSAAPAPGSPWHELLDHVQRSTRPLLLLGAMAQRQGWASALQRLCIPVLTTVAAKGIIDERRPHAAGVFTGAGRRMTPEHRLMGMSDLVVALGVRDYELLDATNFPVPVVSLDVVRTGGGPGGRQVASASGCTAAQFEELLCILSLRTWGAEVIADARDRLRAALCTQPWLPPALLSLVAATTSNACLVADTGSFCTVAEHLWQATDPGGFLCSANGRFMGGGIPMAIGAALADRSRPVVCLVGDGGIAMYFAEIALAVQHDLQILFLHVSDGGYGSIAAALPRARRRRSILVLPGSAWHCAARALACDSHEVRGAHGFSDVLGAWMSAPGPCFVEARFDPESYMRMTAGVR
jgi:acetolactate synthase-1/2/3 large subunit